MVSLNVHVVWCYEWEYQLQAIMDFLFKNLNILTLLLPNFAVSHSFVLCCIYLSMYISITRYNRWRLERPSWKSTVRLNLLLGAWCILWEVHFCRRSILLDISSVTTDAPVHLHWSDFDVGYSDTPWSHACTRSVPTRFSSFLFHSVSWGAILWWPGLVLQLA